jgi:2-dehydro-3-deoxygluconokinase
MPDVITFGEAMVRLTPPHFRRLEQARTLDVDIGGAELNTAVGLARLGHTVAWASRLPDDPLGKLVAARAREAGVDDRFVQFGDGRCGLYFLEVGAAPRASGILYDRKDSAMSRVAPGMFDWPAVFTGAKWFHTSGITAALSAECCRATADALDSARAAGCHTSYDLNFRARLTTPQAARAIAESLAPNIDTLIASAGEAEALFDASGDPASVATELRDRLGIGRVVISSRVDTGRDTQTRRSVSADREVVEAESAEFGTVDPLGGGDAFSAGFLSGLLAEGPARGLEIGGAVAALKQSIPGDFAIVDPEDVAHLLGGGDRGATRR